MRILIVSLLKRKITPKITASRPRMIYELAQGLFKRGHQVTILGTQDSWVPGVETLGVIEKSFVEMPPFENPFYAQTAYLVQLAKKIEQIADKFDIIHNHTYPEFINLMVADKIKTPMVTTVHAQATEELDKVLSLFPNAYLISISHAHKKLFKKAKIDKVVHNGIDTRLYSFSSKKEDYLLWLGRLSKAKNKDGTFMDPKGVRWAIKLARETGEKLLLSGNVEDRQFFETDVKPYLNDKIKWIGPVSPELSLTKTQVVNLMRGAKAFLMTVNWYEPFGLVMAEAMSCGAPVIGFNRGSVSEIVVDGVNGYVVNPKSEIRNSKGRLTSKQIQNSKLVPSRVEGFKIQKIGIEGLKEALAKIDQIDPKDCREHVVKNFSVGKMVEDYEKVYREVTQNDF